MLEIYKGGKKRGQLWLWIVVALLAGFIQSSPWFASFLVRPNLVLVLFLISLKYYDSFEEPSLIGMALIVGLSFSPVIGLEIISLCLIGGVLILLRRHYAVNRGASLVALSVVATIFIYVLMDYSFIKTNFSLVFLEVCANVAGVLLGVAGLSLIDRSKRQQF